MDQVLTFDRSGDVSKLEGCNTRGIEYRWQIFLDAVSTLPKGSNVLDFGAGSLRESFDLANRGFNVTSLDIDGELLSSYREKYQWPSNGTAHDIIATGDLLEGLSRVCDKKFALITCFDVLEHLEDPASALRALKRCMSDAGTLIITVPNGRTLFELAFRLDLMIARATHRHMRPGEPHLQRNSPARWKQIITSAGLTVLEHDMQIGFFANTFAAMVQLPLTLAGRLLRKLGVDNRALELSEAICNGPQKAALAFLDRHTKPVFRGLYGWNLFVVGTGAARPTRPLPPHTAPRP
jgi:2-polyprenyl-3-methyl-5-hydroxy-6-metoxy-1,4-benzoquinol methylase